MKSTKFNLKFQFSNENAWKIEWETRDTLKLETKYHWLRLVGQKVSGMKGDQIRQEKEMKQFTYWELDLNQVNACPEEKFSFQLSVNLLNFLVSNF